MPLNLSSMTELSMKIHMPSSGLLGLILLGTLVSYTALSSSISSRMGAVSTPAILPCPPVGTSASPLPNFPTDFPLPPGLIITGTATLGGNRLQVLGYVLADLSTTVSFLNRALPKAGYYTMGSEAELGDAETDFQGLDFRGRWRVQAQVNCPGISRFTVTGQPYR